MTRLPYNAKAILAALIAGLTALAAAFDGGLAFPEAILAVVAALGAYGAVFSIPNGATDDA